MYLSETLQRYFSRYGEVIDCVVMKNSESGRSRGFGFVTFSDPANVSLVLQNGPHQLDGRTVSFIFLVWNPDNESSNITYVKHKVGITFGDNIGPS